MTNHLTNGVQVRAPREDDLEAIVEMMLACDLSDCGRPDSSHEMLRDEWRDEYFQMETGAWVAVIDERIVAYEAIQRQRFARMRSYGRVHPEYRGLGIGSHLLGLAEQRARELVPCAAPDERVALHSWCHGTNQSGKHLLEAHGYHCVRHNWAMCITMEQPPVEPVWPQGIVLRPFVTERDARSVFEAKEESFRDHWGYLPDEFEHWYQQHVAPREGFDPSLWFIAMDGEQIAGIALCGHYLNEGEIAILGVRRPWRRTGLGLALLYHAFGEFYRRGQYKVGLGVDTESLTGATRLYQRAGMSVELVYDIYEKELRAGRDIATQSLF